MESLAINDLAISIATENGTGSASANTVLFKAIFKMGIPCSSKNMFPSNIQGLPTWYQVRACADGYMGRKDVIDVIVMFNDATAAKDIYRVRDGGLIIYDDSTPLAANLKRDGVQYLGVPANKLIQKIVPASPLRTKQRNMIYVGALAYLFGIDMETIKEVLQDTFGRKPAVIESNLVCIQAGFDHLKEKGFTQSIAKLVAIPNGNKDKIITEGNTACALGAIFGGVSVVSWYPITPSSSLAEAMEYYLPRLRKTKDGKATYAIVQAEDEIAAAGMVIGAGWAGARAMTSTSGPGVSLMNETIGLAYFAEIPSVFFIIQRGGPSTGLPTRTQQSDILLMYYASHGDTRHIILIPHDMKTCFDLARRSFDFAERFQTAVFVMMDLDLGMNLWSSHPLVVEKEPLDRGKLLSAEQLDQWEQQGKKFRRYFDQDGDGIPYRTLPGNMNRRAAYFTRGSGHDADARYSEDEKDYKETLDRLRQKFETARKYVPKPIIESRDAKTGVICFGSSYEPVREARDRLRAAGLKTDHLLLRALPLCEEVREFVASHDRIYLVEQNRDGQMAAIFKEEWPELGTKIDSVLIYDGLPATPAEIVRQIRVHEANLKKEAGQWREKKLIASI
jgi:2-oxoglutarate/2-oxoacid ferredoxin oxidoreductase subunit alpha